MPSQSALAFGIDDEPDALSRFLIIEKGTSVKRSLEVIRDATTGRLSIGGVEMGDTGWRKIASWTAGVYDGGFEVLNASAYEPVPGQNGGIFIRRVHNTVYLAGRNFRGAGSVSAFGINSFINPFAVFNMTGFNCDYNVIPAGRSSLASGEVIAGQITASRILIAFRDPVVAGVTLISGNNSGGNSLLFSGVTVTKDWPTVLPGTQESSPLS